MSLSTRMMKVITSVTMNDRRIGDTLMTVGVGIEAKPVACYLPVIVDGNEITGQHKILRRVTRIGTDKYRMDILEAPIDWVRE